LAKNKEEILKTGGGLAVLAGEENFVFTSKQTTGLCNKFDGDAVETFQMKMNLLRFLSGFWLKLDRCETTWSYETLSFTYD
jgi:hypothetical protein